MKRLPHDDECKMNKATATKSNNPNMESRKALTTGNIDFPLIDMNGPSSTSFVRGKEGVSSEQRKNQVSKGLKEAEKDIEMMTKKQNESERSDIAAASASSNSPLYVDSSSFKKDQDEEIIDIVSIYSNVLRDENEGATDVESVDTYDMLSGHT